MLNRIYRSIKKDDKVFVIVRRLQDNQEEGILATFIGDDRIEIEETTQRDISYGMFLKGPAIILEKEPDGNRITRKHINGKEEIVLDDCNLAPGYTPKYKVINLYNADPLVDLIADLRDGGYRDYASELLALSQEISTRGKKTSLLESALK